MQREAIPSMTSIMQISNFYLSNGPTILKMSISDENESGDLPKPVYPWTAFAYSCDHKPITTATRTSERIGIVLYILLYKNT